MSSKHSQRCPAIARRLAALGRRLWGDRRGSAAILTALGATVLMGFAGLGVDLAYWELNGRKIQSATDAAALAASVAVSAGDTTTQVTNVAQAVIAGYGFVNGQNGATVSTTYPYVSSVTKNCGSASNDCVQVKVTQQQPRYFTRLFFSSSPTVSESAVAQAPSTNTSAGTMCLMALEPSGSGTVSLSGGVNGCLGGNYDPSTGSCTSPTCDLYNDSTDSSSTTFSGSASLIAEHILLSGGYSLGSNSTISPNPPSTYVAPTPDPYSGLSISVSSGVITVSDPYTNPQISSAYSGCQGGSNNVKVNAGNTLTINPGCYSNISVDAGGTLNLNAGTYVIDGGNLTLNSGTGNGGALNGTGVTIILTNSKCTTSPCSSNGNSAVGTISLSSQFTTTLTAPTASATSGVPGIAIWIDKRAAQANNSLNGGANQNINGVIYLPSQNVNYAGGSNTVVNGLPATACTQVLAYNLSISGSAYLTHSYCAQMNIPVRDPAWSPVLAQ